MRDSDEPDDSAADAGDDHATGAGQAPSSVEQLQRAALEAVQAARAVLDVAESMIREPAAVEALVNTVSAMARTATESFAGFAAGMTPTETRRPDSTDSADPDTDEGTYHRIDVD